MRPPILPHLCRAKNSLPACFLYHTSAPLAGQALSMPQKGQNSGSRRRLTDSIKMKPGFRSSKREVTQKTQEHSSNSSRDGLHTSFQRDSLPHFDSNFVPRIRNPSFRRRSRRGGEATAHTQKYKAHDDVRQVDNLRGQRDKPRRTGSSHSADSPSRTTSKVYSEEALGSDFSESRTISEDFSQLRCHFDSPPLMSGMLSCLREVLGHKTSPTPIQALSLKWLLNDGVEEFPRGSWKQFLLASETGSGKSIAYLLPLLQNLKETELDPSLSPPIQPSREVRPARPINPRALVLAPTHELARQLSGTAKSLVHEVKLRILCASRANTKSTKERDTTARQMVAQLEGSMTSGIGEFHLKRGAFPVDVLVGTPMKLLEMVRGRGWDQREPKDEDEVDPSTLRRGRDKMFGVGKWRSKPELGLANVEWVVIDEADVLFDSDFQETTRMLLADISAARSQPVPLSSTSTLSLSTQSSSTPAPAPPIEYPFHFILTSATIPTSLASYLDAHHPKLIRLASPRLHRLPNGMRIEYVNWTGGNKYADIEHRIRRVWADDAASTSSEVSLSKVLIFCNKSSKVEELGKYLDEKGIKNVALSSTSDHRKRGSNHHLDGFLKVQAAEEGESRHAHATTDPKSVPHVMITTSLLSRGLDFTPSIKHVFIVDEPRNMIDFLHRAGRTCRAGQEGKVVIFGKLKGRGSSQALAARKRVGAFVSRR